jgi:hypothetical protein
MALHEPRVGDGVCSLLHSRAAIRLLHEDGEDETVIHLRLLGDIFDGCADALGLGVAVVAIVVDETVASIP